VSRLVYRGGRAPCTWRARHVHGSCWYGTRESECGRVEGCGGVTGGAHGGARCWCEASRARVREVRGARWWWCYCVRLQRSRIAEAPRTHSLAVVGCGGALYLVHRVPRGAVVKFRTRARRVGGRWAWCARRRARWREREVRERCCWCCWRCWWTRTGREQRVPRMRRARHVDEAVRRWVG